MTLRKKCVQQNFFCCPNKTFCLSNQNLIDKAKCLVGTKKDFVDLTKLFSQWTIELFIIIFKK